MSSNYLRERLEAHPHYPSLHALTDLLDEWHVEYQAFQIEDKHRWLEIGFPFLAHVVNQQGYEDFEIIRRRKDIGPQESFISDWTGVTLVIGERNAIDHEEHQWFLRKEQIRKGVQGVFFGLVALAFLVSLIWNSEVLMAAHALLTVVGLIFSIALVSYSYGVNTQISDAFCKVEAQGCNSVLSSKLARFGGDYGLTDLVAIFFGGLFVFHLFSWNFPANSSKVLLEALAWVSWGFTFVSLAYQWRMGSWCRMCLVVTGVLWLQLALLIAGGASQPSSLTLIEIEVYLALASSFLIAGSWLLVKPLLNGFLDAQEQQIRIRKWRQDPAWFDALLPLHKRIDDRWWPKEITAGNPDGILQIIVVSDPYCSSCAKAHRELALILAKHPGDIGARFRFALNAYDPSSDKQQAAAQILGAYDQFLWDAKGEQQPDTHDMLGYWFEHQQLEQWKERYPTGSQSSEVDQMIRQSIDWTNKMQITQTPAFFVNGHEMPNPHTFKDLLLFVSEYLEILKSRTNSSLIEEKVGAANS